MEKSIGLYRQKRLSTPYIHTAQVHNLSAPSEVVPVIMNMLNPKSVLDVGCGIGTWLKVFSDHGVKEYSGVDWQGLNPSELVIPKENFIGADLRKSIDLKRKFDLVMSLEVAEHLPAEVADSHIDSLITHGDVILFSAAIPGQGGQNHLNEQWPSYWQKKFRKRGFYFHDDIRPLIWNNDKVDWWYRQNIFLVTKQEAGSVKDITNVVHPGFLNDVVKLQAQQTADIIEGRQGLKTGLRAFANSVGYKIKSLFK